MMVAKLADIIKIMETIAPRGFAEEWDNTGLQLGKKDWSIRSIWVALDPLPEIVEAASKEDVDLLITHHPLIFRPLSSLDFSTPVGAIVHMAIQHEVAVYSAHTNFDIVNKGLNDILAARIGIKVLEALGDVRAPEAVKLVFYVPAEYEHPVLEAVFETNAGMIDAYTCCTFRNPGKGTFRPGVTAEPFIGKAGEISHVDEIRIETIVAKRDIESVVQHVRKQHPYESMAYDMYPILSHDSEQGVGRVGQLENSIKLSAFAEKVKQDLSLKSVRVVGDPELEVNRVAICTGSGASLMNHFLSSGADVYISGDLRYHDAREAEAANRGLIDVGHFASEFLMVQALTDRLREIISEKKMDVKVKACKLEKDPFYTI